MEFVFDLVKKTPRVRKKKWKGPIQAVKRIQLHLNQTSSDSENDPILAKATIQTVIKQLSKFFNYARKPKLVSGLSSKRFESAIQPSAGNMKSKNGSRSRKYHFF